VRQFTSLLCAICLCGCAEIDFSLPRSQAVETSSDEVSAPDILYRNGASIGIRYSADYREQAQAFLLNACGGTYRVINRNEDENRITADVVCEH
jgi:hypothetical protein